MVEPEVVTEISVAVVVVIVAFVAAAIAAPFVQDLPPRRLVPEEEEVRAQRGLEGERPLTRGPRWSIQW